MTRALFLIAFGILMALPAASQADRALVFAAASLRGALDDIARSYGSDMVISYGGSGAIARQVAAGAPADLVVLANPVWSNWLSGQGIVPKGSATDIAGNTLAVIGPAGSLPLSPEMLLAALGDGRLAMGQRDAVPAGSYAREWLENAGLWNNVAPRLAETDNVRAALALVARGQAPLGIVYATDAMADPAVSVVLPIPPELHSPVRYPAMALTTKGARLLAHLQSPEAQAILAAYGFTKGSP